MIINAVLFIYALLTEFIVVIAAGVCLQWVFGMAMNSSRGYTHAEQQFARTIMSYWANFAKTG